MRFDAINALQKFQDFTPAAKGHNLRIARRSAGDGFFTEFVLILSCEYSGKIEQGRIFHRIEVMEGAGQAYLNEMLYNAFDDIAIKIKEFDEPQREHLFFKS